MNDQVQWCCDQVQWYKATIEWLAVLSTVAEQDIQNNANCLKYYLYFDEMQFVMRGTSREKSPNLALSLPDK